MHFQHDGRSSDLVRSGGLPAASQHNTRSPDRNEHLEATGSALPAERGEPVHGSDQGSAVGG